jgi:hypothetical protein
VVSQTDKLRLGVLIQVPKHVHGLISELQMMSAFRESGSGV